MKEKYNDIEKLNKDLNRLKHINSKGKDKSNKIFFSILGATFVSMIVSSFYTPFLWVYIPLLITTLGAGIVNGVIQFTDYDKRIEKLTDKIQELQEKEQENYKTTNYHTATHNCQTELKKRDNNKSQENENVEENNITLD